MLTYGDQANYQEQFNNQSLSLGRSFGSYKNNIVPYIRSNTSFAQPAQAFGAISIRQEPQTHSVVQAAKNCSFTILHSGRQRLNIIEVMGCTGHDMYMMSQLTLARVQQYANAT